MSIRVRGIGPLIALALMLTSAQCILACAVADCVGRDVAPCHQRNHRHAPKVPLACSRDLGLGRPAHLDTQLSNCDFSGVAFTTAAVVPLPILAAGVRAPSQSPSPPGLTSLSAVALRI